jgi:putative ABC transport system permease protein
MRTYRFLLHLYPASFRHEYGDEMSSIFARRLRDAPRPVGRAAIWALAVWETLANALLVHLDLLRQDLRYVARTLKRSPAFGLTAVAIVALGIGALTAAFTVADFVLIRPLPYRDPDRLVQLWETTPGYQAMELSPPNFRDWMSAARSFDSAGVSHSEALTMVTNAEPHRFDGAALSVGVLPTLGVSPILGRAFTAADDAAGAPGTILLSYSLWQTEFGADPGIVGRRIDAQMDIERDTFTVIGVMPRDFHYPSADAQFWVTTRFSADDYAPPERSNNWLDGVARLRPGVTREQAHAEAQLIASDLRRSNPKENKDTGARVVVLRDGVSVRSRLLLQALTAAAGCVLLIACMNLANLLLARGLERRRELAVRAAMGAGRERVVRQLMTEHLLLAVVGGALGIGLAVVAVPLLSRLVPSTLPIAASPTVDARVIAFAIALTALTGLAFGTAPAMRLVRNVDVEGLHEGGRSGGGRRERLRSALVLAEIAASVVLLVSAALLVRALLRVQGTDPGFDVNGVLTLRAELPVPQYAKVATRDAFHARVLREVRALPGVRAAGFVSFLPISRMRGGIWPVKVAGDADPSAGVRGANNVAALRYVTPGYFAAMAIPLERGRDVTEADEQQRPFVAVVSESFAKRYWPGQDPIGRHFEFAFVDREVVGVVGDVRFRGLERTSEPQAYLPSGQVPDNWITFYAPRALAVRVASGPPSALAPAVRAIIRNADPSVAVTEVQTLADMVDSDTASRATQVRVLGAFAAIAFVLAAIGIHGLLSFAVSQRTQEIGVRVALGAQPRDVVGMVVANAARLGALGLGLGVVLAYAAGRSLEALLAGVRPSDGQAFAAAVALTAVMLVAGTLVPVLRALRIDPIRAIRSE